MAWTRAEIANNGNKLWKQLCSNMIIIIIITRLVTHVKSFTKSRIASAGGHESAKVSSVVKFSLYQTLESCKTGEIGDYIWW